MYGKSLWIALLYFTIDSASYLHAATDRYRCMWREDPATTMVIGWDQVSGQNPVVYYDEIDFGTQTGAYRDQQQPDRIVRAKGMNNHFVRLRGLKPNTTYYFVIKDSDSVSKRMAFRTTPDNPAERLSIIAGGDSRNNQEARISANRLVSKLRPHLVAFSGDMTGGDTDSEWKEWFDDWQKTMGSDGRLFPIVTARGNHERENASITELFDVSSSEVYYALSFGGGLLRLYTLNSRIAAAGKQQVWLESDLKANAQVAWKMAQYHEPMRPHTRKKAERDDLYESWAGLFYDYKVSLVMESDAHIVKITHPVRPYKGAGSEKGFIRDDENGTVYIGEGGWGAPLREANNDKAWTMASGSFNQFKWIFVSEDRLEIRTVGTDRSLNVAEVRDDDIFEPPIGLVLWNPPAGDVVTIPNRNYQRAIAQSAPASRPAASRGQQADVSNKPEKPSGPNPDDRDDWSGFDKLIPDADGVVTIRFEMPKPGEVVLQLINRDWKIVNTSKMNASKAGALSPNINLSSISSGEYLLLIRGDGALLKRYWIVKR